MHTKILSEYGGDDVPFIAAISSATLDILYSGLPRIPELGEEVYAKAFDMQIGGGPPATIITLNRLGIHAKIGTFLGADGISDFVRNILKKYNIDYTNLYKGKEIPVAVTSIASFPEDRSFLTYNHGIDEKICTDDEIYKFLKGSKVCFGVKGHNHVLKRLKEEGSIIVYDIGWHDELHVDQIKDILECVSVFTPNEKEALKMTNTSNVVDALDVLEEYVDCTVITLGNKGCISKTKEGIVKIPSIGEFETVDTTGAGDNFLAGVMFGLYHDMSIEDCMKIGNIVGGYSTTQLGCCRANINLDKLEYYLQKYYGQ